MNKLISIYIPGFLLIWAIGCNTKELTTNTIVSPSDNISVEFFLKQDGSPNYLVRYKGNIMIDTSSMGFDFREQTSLLSGLRIIGTETNTVNEDWEMPWGEQRIVSNHYNELVVKLEEDDAPNRKLNIYFRAYNDGLGFRYEFPEQVGVDSVTIVDENTQFKLTGDHTCWWIPGDWDIYEHLYSTTKFSEIDALAKRNHPNLAQSYIPENAVNTPLTMRTVDGLHLSFHEANLTDYAGMTLKIDRENLSMTSELVGSDRLGYKVKRSLPFVTPWRSIQISETAAGLIESNLIVNLNEPNKLGDVSWFRPMKYVGIWWEMHLGISTWDIGATQDMSAFNNKEKEHKSLHGATTENAKKYIDFASKNNIKGLLVEGWNTGWEHWIGFEDREGVFDFVTPYPDYNLKEVVRYGREKGVELIMHHETSAAPRTYEQQLDTAYTLMQSLGIHAVKTGYVGKIIPNGEYHHGQWMVNHYRKVLETAAKYDIAINAHEPIKATGIRRTYPNAISREGLRGQEFNAWASDGGNPPEHLSIIAFTRMLAGPIDFTPGVFEISLKEKPNNQINTTLAQQLALYVVIYSPVQMACDLPKNYIGNPALQFIRDVGVDWEQTKVLNGEVGDFVTIARQEKETGNWFVGSITDEEKRKITINFDFLDPAKEYEATIYRDGQDAHWHDNPTSYVIEKTVITKDTIKSFILVEGGGLAISLKIKE
jgi:glucan 1,4-alpha-glucosidase